jgi:hypothetical protein
MRVVPPPTIHLHDLDETEAPIDQLLHLSEHTPLLIGGPESGRQEAEDGLRGKDHTWTAMGLIKDWEGFWFYGIFLALCIGPVSSLFLFSFGGRADR